MLVHFYLTDNTLFDLIRFRILDGYRPIVGSKVIDDFGYLDGLENISIARVAAQPPQSTNFILNVADPNSSSVVPAPGASQVNVPSVTLKIQGDLFMIAPADLPTSPDSNGAYPRPKRFRLALDAEIALYMTENLNSDSVLHADVYQSSLDVLGIKMPSFSNIAIPLPMSSALSGVVAPTARVLNAGIASTSDKAGFVIRIEADDPQLPNPNDRMTAWNSFFAGQQPSALGIRAWAAEVPTTYLVQTATTEFDQQMSSPAVEKILTNYDPSWGNWTWNQPQLTLQKRGVFEHACQGLDFQALITVTASLSVPAGNTLRVSMHLDVAIDDWDTFKCGLLSVLNPLGVAITAFDNSSTIPWYFGIGLGIIERVSGPMFMFVLALANPLLTSYALKQVQDSLSKSGANLIRTSDTDCYVDIAISLGALGSAAWLTLQEVAGIQDHLVIRGDYRPPSFAVPLFVSGALIEPFGGWEKPKCTEPRLSAYKTTASLQFSLLDPSGNSILSPAIAMKCGVDADTGQDVCWRVVDDPLGVYSPTRAETLYYWTGAGVPGVFEVIVGAPPQTFADNPYELHLQLLTSYGTRQYNIPAPPVGPKLPSNQREVIAEAAYRISQCYAISSLLSLIKALQFQWLPNPPPILKVAQHWQVQVEGLTQNDWLRAWDAERGTLLGEVRPWADNLAELSLITDTKPVRVVQVTLNDQHLMSPDEYSRLSAGVEGQPQTALNPVTIKQTELLHLTEIALPGRADGVSLRVASNQISILVWDAQNTWKILMPPRGLQSWAITRLAERSEPRPFLPIGGIHLKAGIRDGRPITRILNNAGADIGRFSARPWYDRGSVSGRFYARLNDGGDHVVLYGRCSTRIAYPQISDRET
jgi:hypothetical protein